MNIGPYAITRGTKLPYKIKGDARQSVNVATNGGVNVGDDGWSTKLFTVTFSGSKQLMDGVFGYIMNGVRMAAIPFTYVDDYGKTWTVRYWGRSPPEYKSIASDLYEMTLVLRKEI